MRVSITTYFINGDIMRSFIFALCFAPSVVSAQSIDYDALANALARQHNVPQQQIVPVLPVTPGSQYVVQSQSFDIPKTAINQSGGTYTVTQIDRAPNGAYVPPARPVYDPYAGYKLMDQWLGWSK